MRENGELLNPVVGEGGVFLFSFEGELNSCVGRGEVMVSGCGGSWTRDKRSDYRGGTVTKRAKSLSNPVAKGVRFAVKISYEFFYSIVKELK